MTTRRTPWVTGVAITAALALTSTAVAQTTTLFSPNRQQGGIYGGAIAVVPDLNGDGIDDFVVGAPDETVNGIQEAGRVYVYSGATRQLIRTIVSPTPLTAGGFGSSVGGVPDVNNDGRGDIAIGAPRESTLDTPFCGKAYIFSGATGQLIAQMVSPARRTGGNFGAAVAGLTDVNGDGRGNVAIGAPGDNPGASPAACGRVYIYRWNGGLFLTVRAPVELVNGNFGASVAMVPDVNGDGRADLIVGAPRVHHAQFSEPIHVGRAYLIDGTTGRAMRHLRSPAYTQNGFFGTSVAGLTDITGDGHGDFVVGAPGDRPGANPPNTGRAYIYNGNTGQFVRTLIPPIAQEDGEFGFAVAGLPDTTGDGKMDVVVSGWKQNWSTQPTRAGVVHIYNSVTGQRVQSLLSPHAQLEGLFGATVAGIRDLNNNNMGDIIVGAPAQTSGGITAAGNVYVFYR
jgi:hypothetical protein